MLWIKEHYKAIIGLIILILSSVLYGVGLLSQADQDHYIEAIVCDVVCGIGLAINVIVSYKLIIDKHK